MTRTGTRTTAYGMRTGLAAAAVLALAGCGGGSGGSGDDFAKQSASDIISAAKTDMQDLSSLSMHGDITSSGQKIGFDLDVTTKGDCQGTIKLGDGSAQILSAGGDSWMKPDDAFWQEQAGDQAKTIEDAVGDKWVAIPGSSDSLSSACDLDSLLSKLKDGKGDTEGTVGDTSSVGGEDAVEVTSKEEADDVKAYVATGDKHYILKLEIDSGDSPGTVTFDNFDQDFSIQPPASSDVADLSSLGG